MYQFLHEQSSLFTPEKKYAKTLKNLTIVYTVAGFLLEVVNRKHTDLLLQMMNAIIRHMNLVTAKRESHYVATLSTLPPFILIVEAKRSLLDCCHHL
jgi:hypothetical protein